jgi:hypothetical protein
MRGTDPGGQVSDIGESASDESGDVLHDNESRSY